MLFARPLNSACATNFRRSCCDRCNGTWGRQEACQLSVQHFKIDRNARLPFRSADFLGVHGRNPFRAVSTVDHAVVPVQRLEQIHDELKTKSANFKKYTGTIGASSHAIPSCTRSKRTARLACRAARQHAHPDRTTQVGAGPHEGRLAQYPRFRELTLNCPGRPCGSPRSAPWFPHSLDRGPAARHRGRPP